jgi:hypothetical protein
LGVEKTFWHGQSEYSEHNRDVSEIDGKTREEKHIIHCKSMDDTIYQVARRA